MSVWTRRGIVGIIALYIVIRSTTDLQIAMCMQSRIPCVNRVVVIGWILIFYFYF